MKRFFCWALVMTGFVYSACDDDDNDGIQEVDRTFVMNASEANQAEIELGQLASTKSATPEVAAFGQMMVTEHQTALDELDSIADAKDVTMNTQLNAKHQELKQRLSTLVGYSFDTAYMRSQVMDHETTATLFQNEINSGRDQDVKNYASKYLPHVQMHLNEAEEILGTLED
jgi:putative membrane protein